MNPTPEDTLIERVLTMILGGFCGLVYGFLIAVLVGLVTDQFSGRIVGWSTGVFAVAGFVYGNIIMEALLGLLHFFVGLANGLTENERFEPEREAEPHLRAFALVGFFTGLIILVAVYL
jgi:MFS family permease